MPVHTEMNVREYGWGQTFHVWNTDQVSGALSDLAVRQISESTMPSHTVMRRYSYVITLTTADDPGALLAFIDGNFKGGWSMRDYPPSFNLDRWCDWIVYAGTSGRVDHVAIYGDPNLSVSVGTGDVGA